MDDSLISLQQIQMCRDWFFFSYSRKTFIFPIAYLCQVRLDKESMEIKWENILWGHLFLLKTKSKVCQCFNSKIKGWTYSRCYRWIRLNWVYYVHLVMNRRYSLWWERLDDTWRFHSFNKHILITYLMLACRDDSDMIPNEWCSCWFSL